MTRPRSSGILLLLAAFFALNVPTTPTLADSPTGKQWVYIGTYTGKGEKDSKGIYLFEFDLATGKLTSKGLAAETANPSFLAIHPNKKFLYAVGVMTEGTKSVGAVVSFSLNPETGKLKELNKQASGGGGPCQVTVDKEGKCVMVANYGGGSVASLQIKDDGSLKEAASVMQHKGSSVNPKRQEGPHAHSINVDKGNRFAFAADLGLDKILVYKLDASKGTLTANDPPSVSVLDGAGPRHFAFHPSGKYAYVINELNMTVTVFSYDAEKGLLKEIQTITTLPKDAKGTNFSTAEVVVHPSGKFLYGSNRGHHSIAVFSIDEATGKLSAVSHPSTEGKTPRNFNVDPTGTYLFAANQDSNNVVVFRIDQKTGDLKATGESVEVPRPVCVRFLVK